jgi:hypothetical protein
MAAKQVVAASPTRPAWLFDDYQKFNPLADVGLPLCNKEWIQ